MIKSSEKELLPVRPKAAKRRKKRKNATRKTVAKIFALHANAIYVSHFKSTSFLENISSSIQFNY